MDFKDILNHEDDEKRRPRGSSGAQSRSNTLPTLHTTPSESPSIARSRTLHDDQYFPLQTSPAGYPPPQLPRSASYQSGPYSAGSPIGPPLSHQLAPISPHAQSPSTGQPPTSLHRHVSHPSQASTPTSMYPPTPYGTRHSPVVSQSPYGQAPPPLGYPAHPITPAASYPHPLQHAYQQQPQRRVLSNGPPPNMHSQMSSPDSRQPLYPQRISSAGHPLPGPYVGHVPTAAPIVHPMHAPPSIPRSQHSRQSSSLGATGRERTQSVSVSPKTLVTDLPSRAGSLNGSLAGQPVAPVAEEVVAPSSGLRGSVQPRSDSYQSDFLERPRAQQRKGTHSSEPFEHTSSPLTSIRPRPEPSRTSQPPLKSAESSGSILDTPARTPMDTTKAISNAPPTLKRALDSDAVIAQQPPPAKRRRGTEVPMWARQASGTAPLPKYRGINVTNGGSLPNKPAISTAASAPNRSEALITTPLNTEPPMILEASFKDEQPFEDVHKAVCDFLFGAVVQNLNFDTTRSALGELEIEAKLGTIIDRNTNERIRLPTLSEAVLPEGYHVAFESMMTEQEHSQFNSALNDAVAQSHGLGRSQSKPRAKIEYVHRYEIDTFYALPQEEIQSLPPSIIPLVHNRRSNVRVTKDMKTGEVLAQIVKVRLADMHVFSPKTRFDWRVSVSAEVHWNGDVKQLMAIAASSKQAKPQPDRNKDRMSYKHQYCQIDLTQVKAEANAGSDKATHELEVELDATIVRQQGRLAEQGMPNIYDKVVRTLIDNVRILTRVPGGRQG